MVRFYKSSVYHLKHGLKLPAVTLDANTVHIAFIKRNDSVAIKSIDSKGETLTSQKSAHVDSNKLAFLVMNRN